MRERDIGLRRVYHTLTLVSVLYSTFRFAARGATVMASASQTVRPYRFDPVNIGFCANVRKPASRFAPIIAEVRLPD
jgi:hypothetical protein